MMNQVVKVIISQLDLFLIDKVRELRGRAKPYISQSTLSLRIGFAEGFIGKVENFKSGTKYNNRHIGLIAKALNIESYNTLYPSKICDNDLLELEIKLNKDNRKVKFDESDNVVKNYTIINCRVLTEKEVIEYNRTRVRTTEEE